MHGTARISEGSAFGLPRRRFGLIRIALGVALAHGAGILLALWLIQDPAATPPRPIAVHLQSESVGTPATALQTASRAPRTQEAPRASETPRAADVSRATDIPRAAEVSRTSEATRASEASRAAPASDRGERLASPAAPAEPSASQSLGGGESALAGRSVASNTDDRQPLVDASFKGNRIPEYPAASRRLGEQGTVVLRVLIAIDGRASEVQLLHSSGFARLDRAALAAIKEWRFLPALKAGRPVAAWYEWRWEFRLSQ